MTYNHTVVFIVPISNQQIAKQISMAFDPDIGGYEAFETYLSSDGTAPATHVMYSTPCTDSFLELLSQALTSAEYLKTAVDADYEARWPDETAPTLVECQLFIDGLAYSVDSPAGSLLELEGLCLVTS